MKILALAPNWIGDAAMCTPALRALRAAYPDAALTVAGRPAVVELLEGLAWIDRLERVPARPGVLDTLRTVGRLRPHARDLAVAFPHGFRAALWAGLCGSRRRLGHDRDGRGWLLTDRVQPHRVAGHIEPVYMAQEYVDLLAPLGCRDDAKGLELAADADAVAKVEAFFGGQRPRIGIAPGAAFGPSKMWLPERYAAVADMLAQQAGAQCVVLTGPGEEKVRDTVIGAAKTPIKVYDSEPPSIRMLKALIARLDLLVCNDSGARHVAVAFNVPTICMMGPTSPKYSCGPYERGRVLRIDVDCGPCQKPVCETDHRCMTGITADAVACAALDVLQSRE